LKEKKHAIQVSVFLTFCLDPLVRPLVCQEKHYQEREDGRDKDGVNRFRIVDKHSPQGAASAVIHEKVAKVLGPDFVRWHSLFQPHSDCQQPTVQREVHRDEKRQGGDEDSSEMFFRLKDRLDARHFRSDPDSQC
jgi:hypothetical protein